MKYHVVKWGFGDLSAVCSTSFSWNRAPVVLLIETVTTQKSSRLPLVRRSGSRHVYDASQFNLFSCFRVESSGTDTQHFFACPWHVVGRGCYQRGVLACSGCHIILCATDCVCLLVFYDVLLTKSCARLAHTRTVQLWSPNKSQKNPSKFHTSVQPCIKRQHLGNSRATIVLLYNIVVVSEYGDGVRDAYYRLIGGNRLIRQ
ncbi:unnamed protein product [Laminaria digitata]